jgi:hypothetical protein
MSAPNSEDIYQAGIVAGKAFGARRLPTNATLFEFEEIFRAQQFSTGKNLNIRALS